MACLTSSQRTYYQSRIDKLNAELVLIDDALDKSLTNSEIESYKFSDGGGTQETKRRTPKQLLDAQKYIENRIRYYTMKLNQTGLKYMRLER